MNMLPTTKQAYDVAIKAMTEEIQTLRAKVASAEGWQLVPIELNRKQKQAMIWAYEEAMGGARLPDGDAYDETIVQKMHEAMLSATPAPSLTSATNTEVGE